jgi:hypothetical protein
MRLSAYCRAFALLLVVLCIPRWASAQADGPSDEATELFTEIGPIGGFGLPPPKNFGIVETSNELSDVVFLMGGHEIEFREFTGATGAQLSDRLSISQFQIRMASDREPGGLPARGGVTRIRFNALESFRPLEIFAKSDGNPNQTGPLSDSLTITVGSFGPGTVGPIFSGIIPETSETLSEHELRFVIPAAFYDIEELGPSGDPFISDYFDIPNDIVVSFLSSDEPGRFGNLPPPTGFVLEDPQFGGGLVYAVDFRSDIEVPEPASFLGLGLATLLIARRRPSR